MANNKKETIDDRIKQLKKKRTPIARYGVPIVLGLGSVYAATLAYRVGDATIDFAKDFASGKDKTEVVQKQQPQSSKITLPSGKRISFVDPTKQYDTLQSVSGEQGYSHKLNIGNNEIETYQRVNLSNTAMLEIATKYKNSNQLTGSKFKLIQNGKETTGQFTFDNKSSELSQITEYISSIKDVVGKHNQDLAGEIQSILVNINARNDSGNFVKDVSNTYNAAKDSFMEFAYLIQKKARI